MKTVAAQIIRVFVMLLACFTVQLQAHDIGVTELSFTQVAPHQFYLDVELSSSLEGLIGPPLLPKQCKASSGSEKPKSNVIRYVFECDEPLTAEDTITLPWQRTAVLVTARWQKNVSDEPVLPQALFLKNDGVIVIELSELSAAGASLTKRIKKFLVLGYAHILEGYDHLLFVLCLVLLLNGWWRLASTITAFTLAHSATLALAYLDWIRLSSGPVEASIALSIVFLAREAIQHQRGQRSLLMTYPWLVAGGFGLLHGLGFASALRDINVVASDIPVALLFFNLGVELGQLCFIGVVLLGMYLYKYLLSQFTHRYQVETGMALFKANGNAIGLLSYSAIAAFLIGGIAMHWTLERSFSLFF